MNGLDLARKVADQFAQLSDVEAVALGGSQSTGVWDYHSDIDLYVYSKQVIPLEKRLQIVEKIGANRADMNLTFWDTGDEWFDLETGIEVDVIYWRPTWIEEQLDRVLVKHQASLGYTTCHWRTVKNSQIFYDRNGWFEELQKKCDQPYPPQLKRAIIEKNHPLLRTVIPSYFGQIKKALGRDDLISINHRLAALFASFFDILFALNEILNPGEKKTLTFVKSECSLGPESLKKQIANILQLAGVGDVNVLKALDALLNDLDNMLKAEDFHPDQFSSM
jgi:predicted nucleotidyltransferase